MASPMEEVRIDPQGNRFFTVAAAIGLKSVPQITINIGKIIVEISHDGFVSSLNVVRIENGSIILKWKIGKSLVVLLPALVVASGELHFTRPGMTKVLQGRDSNHQLQNKLSSLN